ncbi:type VII secretion protein EccB [Kineosporia sp. NBRC 101731]|uniref:type VII secretion protein EccB n=1 Tax=Kineosporia sp. NBRC 101731 TaxID=3032199 RepID=UPI0024A11371|nr:type VII secretion protein EccB [Kineosporia sp. NBRC 101731]GLY31528.1 hypothetical protein Kisp02_48930 [Kineosporia sp. NBRC 101731]
MQTQRDHVQAYGFQAGRLSSALLTGEAAFLEPPARRAKLGLMVGVGLMVLIAVGFFLVGLIRGQVGSKQEPTPTSTVTATASPTAVPSSSSPQGSPAGGHVDRPATSGPAAVALRSTAGDH